MSVLRLQGGDAYLYVWGLATILMYLVFYDIKIETFKLFMLGTFHVVANL